MNTKIKIDDVIRNWKNLKQTSYYYDLFNIMEANKEFYINNAKDPFDKRLTHFINSYIVENRVLAVMNAQLSLRGDNHCSFTDKDRDYVYYNCGGSLPDIVSFEWGEFRFYEVKCMQFANSESHVEWYLNNGIQKNLINLHSATWIWVYVIDSDCLYLCHVLPANAVKAAVVKSNCGWTKDLVNLGDLNVQQ